jgi:hypothetical protein
MRKALNLILVLLGIIGFFFASFYLIYYNVKGGFLISLFFMILFLEAFILRTEKHADEEHIKGKARLIQTPLSSGFMLTSIMGALLSIFVIIPFNLAWGFTFVVVFIIMFIASIVSMTQAPVGEQDLVNSHMEQLGFHYRMHHRRSPFKKK